LIYTLLEEKKKKSEPNFRLLEKLKKEMAKIFFSEQAAVATNTVHPPPLNTASDIHTPPSMTDLKFPPLKRAKPSETKP